MNAATAATTPRAVGAYLAGVQFLFVLGWIVYAAYLPQLLAQVGLERKWVPWLLAADQLIFLVTDLAVGVWSDRAAAVQGRIARWVLGATLLSCAAFLLLPLAAGSGSLALFLGLTLVWTVTSSALRAPPLTLLGRYVARPSQPAMVALVAFGLGLANAIAPYVVLALKGVDPRWPFAMSAAVLAAVTLGMVAAERSLAAPRSAARPALPAATALRSGLLFVAACVAAALAFQAHVFLASGPLWLRHADAAQLPALLPIFWVAFSLVQWPASGLTHRLAPLPAMALGAVLATCGVALAVLAGSVPALGLAQALAGSGWGLFFCAALAAALALGAGGREGLFNGALQSTLALAAMARLGIVATLAPAAPQLQSWAPWSASGFALAALVLLVMAAVRRRG
jgi:Major Facilitator Superfamily